MKLNMHILINSRWSVLVCFVVCTMAFLPKAHTQNFFDQNNIREVRITFPDGNWSKKLKALKEREPDRRIVGSVSIDGMVFDSVGVRYKGNSSYNNPSKKEQRKLPLNIKLDYARKGQELPGGISTLKLSNAFRDPSYVREPLAYEVARQYMPVSESNFAKVYINNEYMGLYNNTESVDQAFLVKHFGNKGRALFKCDPDDWQAFTQKAGCKLSKEASLTVLGNSTDCYKDLYELTGADSNYQALVKLVLMLEKEPEKAAEILDIDQVLWMLAFNNLFVNLDSYNGYLSHNYYLFLDNMGQFRPILWDMNLCFGGFRYNGKALYTTQELIEYAPLAGADDPNRPLISKLLVGDFNRKLYFHHMRTMIEDWVETKRYFTSASQMQGLIESSVVADKQKLYSFESFKENLKASTDAGKTEVIGLSELMEGRVFYLKGLAELRTPAPQFEKPTKTIENEQVTFKCTAKNADAIWLMYRANANQLFKRVLMENKPDSGNKITLPVADAQEYYFVAEGDQSSATFPARASFEYLRLKD